MSVRFAYYCSGHGYGHATRVSAFASSLLSLDVKPSIYIVSSAPSHVFSECINSGAHYRNADVDPVIVQPLAVDRQRSIQVLQAFLSQKEEKLAAEVKWLLSEQIDCVLSDAVFLACEAATKACIPSMLITNFTFDSVYSYLGAQIIDGLSSLPNDNLRVSSRPDPVHQTLQDSPIPEEVLAPLVSQLLAGYRHADILLLLPGFIPIPSFFKSIPLPAPAWINYSTNRFQPEVESILRASTSLDSSLLSSIPFPAYFPENKFGAEGLGIKYPRKEKPSRAVKQAPLLVRPASVDIHTPQGRSNFLLSIGIPKSLHDDPQTRILVVSFGGQKIRRPHGGRSPSRTPSPFHQATDLANQQGDFPLNIQSSDIPNISVQDKLRRHNSMNAHSRTPSARIFIPGAPAPVTSPTSPEPPTSVTLALNGAHALHDDTILSSPPFDEPSLLPSSSWIAVICGVPTDWSVSGDGDEALPAGFYLAPPNVYMPDLTAVADVLMGKLGYGTVSECIAQSTPLIYVPRPLFVEEHGLRLFLEAEGIGVELSRDEYETGAWANKVEEAYFKSKKRERVYQGSDNVEKVKELANWVVRSVEEWTQS